MKKIKSNLTLSLLTLLSLCACSNNEPKYYSLQIWTYYNGSTETSFQAIVDKFNETEGEDKRIAVTAQSQGKSVDDLLNALLNSAKNNAGTSKLPDLFLAYSDTAYELDKLGKIACINDYFSDEELKNFSQGFLNEGDINSNGKILILPMSKSTEALFINKTDFEKFTSQYPELDIQYSDLNTIEDLIDVSKKYYEKTGKSFFGRDSLDNYFVIGAKELGIDILHYDKDNHYGINFDKSVFKTLWDSYYVPFVNGYFNAVGRYRSDDIKTGDVLAYVGSTSSGGYFPDKVVKEDTSYDIECKVLPAPKFKNGGNYAVSQGAGFCITKSDEKQEEASATFLKWLSKKENIQSFCGNSGYFPATLDGFDDSFVTSQTNNKFKETFKVAKQTVTDNIMYSNVIGEGGSSYRTKLKNSLNYLCSSTKAAIEKAEDKQSAIEEYTSLEKFEAWYQSLME